MSLALRSVIRSTDAAQRARAFLQVMRWIENTRDRWGDGLSFKSEPWMMSLLGFYWRVSRNRSTPQ